MARQKEKHLGAVAHVRDETRARWWRFDDETVTAMPGGPIGEHGDHGVASAERKVRRIVLPCVFIEDTRSLLGPEHWQQHRAGGVSKGREA